MRATELSMVCDGLLFKISQRTTDANNRGFAVALTSLHPGAGVTDMTNSLADALGQEGEPCAIALSSRTLSQSGAPSTEPGEVGEDLSRIEKAKTIRDSWHNTQANLATSLEKLRLTYRYVLIDCPSMKEAQDAIRLAPLVDGIVLVIEANRTKREQMLYAERAIEAAKGKILGHVLNKRTYVVPDWLYWKMEALGI
jgi:hypothetical protein